MNTPKHIQVKSGLFANWQQFTLLVFVNMLVGGMIGMERSIFPQFAETQFGIRSSTAILSFIIAFGITKAISNYFAGKLANRFGRKNILLFGWLLAIPVPLLLINATHWNWVIAANLLLGISQGLTWSSTVIMKIDLAGEKDRGLAMGFNEFAGYVAVGLIAFLSGYVAQHMGITPYPFYIGLGIALAGLLITLIWVKDTRAFVEAEGVVKTSPVLTNVFRETSFTNTTLSSVTQAGLVNNLNDGMIWGLFPILLFSFQFDIAQIGVLTAIYPTAWGFSQLITGKLSDIYPKKKLIFWGMFLQGIVIFCIPFSSQFMVLAILAALLGIGTALVYPTFLSTIAGATAPEQRAESIGTFRLWRDLGYVAGALISGFTADIFGIETAFYLIGGLTVLSALLVQIRMPASVKRATPCIEAEKLYQLMQTSQHIVVIDVRHEQDYKKGHIPQALHMAYTHLSNQISTLQKQTRIITVGENGQDMATDAAEKLCRMGYNAMRLCGGTSKWPYGMVA
jgi:predicted MFS family arabinose efflux permease